MSIGQWRKGQMGYLVMNQTSPHKITVARLMLDEEMGKSTNQSAFYPLSSIQCLWWYGDDMLFCEGSRSPRSLWRQNECWQIFKRVGKENATLSQRSLWDCQQWVDLSPGQCGLPHDKEGQGLVLNEKCENASMASSVPQYEPQWKPLAPNQPGHFKTQANCEGKADWRIHQCLASCHLTKPLDSFDGELAAEVQGNN